MIDYEKEQLITFADAVASLPVPIATATMRAWCTLGVDGVVLESCRIGGNRYTSKEAVERFLAKLNEQKAP